MSARARADAFARALDTGEPGEHAELVDALSAARVDLLARTAPSEDFRERARGRLLAVADVQGVGALQVDPTPVREPVRRRWLRPVAAVCASLVIVVAALVGISVASRHALPGDLLYGAKRTTEAIQLRRTDGTLDQGVARLHLAEKRLAEVRALTARSDGHALGASGDGPLAGGASSAALIRSTLDDMDSLTRTGSALVEQVAAHTGSPAPLQVLQAWSGMQSGHIRDVATTVPVDARDRIAASLTLVDGLAARTTELLAQH